MATFRLSQQHFLINTISTKIEYPNLQKIKMQFKRGSPTFDEFRYGPISPFLKIAAKFVDGYFEERLHKPMVVTCVLRSIQDQIGRCRFHKIHSDFDHCLGQALDIRSSNLKNGERQAAIDFVNGILHKLCKLSYHPKGTAPHLHLNLIGEYRKGKDHLWAMVKNAGIDKEEFEQYFTG